MAMLLRTLPLPLAPDWHNATLGADATRKVAVGPTAPTTFATSPKTPNANIAGKRRWLTPLPAARSCQRGKKFPLTLVTPLPTPGLQNDSGTS